MNQPTTTTPLSVSIGFISLGCAKNLADSQVMAGVLLSENIRLAPSPEEADIVLVNTCAFIEDARTEAAEAILRACAHKAEGRCRAVIVAGCLPQRYRDRMQESFPDVDAFLGVDELEQVGRIVREVSAGRGKILAVSREPPTRLFRPRLPALRFSGGPFAYLKVAEGCDHACAFCAIPGIRGRYRSRGMEELVAEARALLDSGARELNLISQDTTSYGRDLASADPADLPALIRALDALPGTFWIRILYGYPSRVTGELLEAMAASRHVCAYLDLPIQHSHPDVLRAMRRVDTLASVADLPRRLRSAVPGLVLRTTCLVGFPGETDAHFEHLQESVAAARFDHLGVFVYSPEDGTAAATREDVPPVEVAKERRDRLMRLQQWIVNDRLRARFGTEETALLLHPEARKDRGGGNGKRAAPAVWIARLAGQAPEVDGITRVRGAPADARPGQFLSVRIVGARGYDLDAKATGLPRKTD